MAHRGDAILGALPAAGEQRIGRHIDIRPIMVFMSEPAPVTGRERTFQRNDALLCLCLTLVAKQESNRVARSEATGKKVLGYFVHLDSSNPSVLRAQCHGPLAAEA